MQLNLVTPSMVGGKLWLVVLRLACLSQIESISVGS